MRLLVIPGKVTQKQKLWNIIKMLNITLVREYEGSITLDKKLCEAAGLQQYDVVEVNNFNGNRDRTYILFGQDGCCQINGALSARHKVGDEIHVLAFEVVTAGWYRSPKIIITKYENGKNIIL